MLQWALMVMNKKQSNKIFSLFLLLVFVLAHLPITPFHEHDHAPECILYTSDLSEATETHWHESENENCFVCATSIQKTLGFFLTQDFDYFRDFPKQYFTSDQSLLAVTLQVDNSRAPPVTS